MMGGTAYHYIHYMYNNFLLAVTFSYIICEEIEKTSQWQESRFAFTATYLKTRS